MATTATPKNEVAERDVIKPDRIVYHYDPKALELLESSAKKYQLAQIQHLPKLVQTMVLAEGITTLRKQVKSLLPQIKPLIGTPLGFLTDKDKETDQSKLYNDDILTECMTQALIRGFYWVNNEFNIIAGKCMGVKNGYKRLVEEHDGISDLDLVPGIPKIMSGGALTSFEATFKLHGYAKKLVRTFPVKLHQGQGADVAIGKGERRMYAAIHTFLTGTEHTDDDGGEAAETPNQGQIQGQTRTDALTDRLKAQGGEATVSGVPGVTNQAGSAPGSVVRAAGADAETVLFPQSEEK